MANMAGIAFDDGYWPSLQRFVGMFQSSSNNIRFKLFKEGMTHLNSDYPSVRLKFELTNQDSAGGKTVLS